MCRVPTPILLRTRTSTHTCKKCVYILFELETEVIWRWFWWSFGSVQAVAGIWDVSSSLLSAHWFPLFWHIWCLHVVQYVSVDCGCRRTLLVILGYCVTWGMSRQLWKTWKFVTPAVMLEWWQSGNSFPSALTPSGPSTHFHHASDNRLLCRGSLSFRQNFTLNLLSLTLSPNSRQGFAKRKKNVTHSEHLHLRHVHFYLSDLKAPCSEILSAIRYIPQVIMKYCVASSAYRRPCG